MTDDLVTAQQGASPSAPNGLRPVWAASPSTIPDGFKEVWSADGSVIAFANPNLADQITEEHNLVIRIQEWVQKHYRANPLCGCRAWEEIHAMVNDGLTE